MSDKTAEVQEKVAQVEAVNQAIGVIIGINSIVDAYAAQGEGAPEFIKDKLMELTVVAETLAQTGQPFSNNAIAQMIGMEYEGD